MKGNASSDGDSRTQTLNAFSSTLASSVSMPLRYARRISLGLRRM
jgi:hypothetical protein